MIQSWKSNDGSVFTGRFGDSLKGNQFQDVGLVVQSVSGMKAKIRGGALDIVATNSDPYVVFLVPPAPPRVGVLWFELEAKKPLVRPAVYLDYGDGFSETYRLDLVQTKGGRWSVELPDVYGVRRVRFDPSEAPCRLALRRAAISVLRQEAKPAFSSHNIVLNRLVGLDLNFGTGDADLQTDDPQIHFGVSRNLAHEPYIRITLKVAAEDEHLVQPKLYLREDETSLVDFARTGSGSYSALVVLPGLIEALRLDPADSAGHCRLIEFSATAVPAADLDGLQGQRRKGPIDLSFALAETLRLNPGPNRPRNVNIDPDDADDLGDVGNGYGGRQVSFTRSYDEWRSSNDVSPARLELQRRFSNGLAEATRFSIIVPVYKVDAYIFEQLVDSVLAQSYPYWELCIALSFHDDPELTKAVTHTASIDERIKVKVLGENLGISGNSNAALAMATGEYIVLLDHDDLITRDAIFEMAEVVRNNPGVDLVYSDKDMIDAPGVRRHYPLFKPEWSPDLMLSVNYLTHLNALRRQRVLDIGGWDSSTDGAQDWDIFLRTIGTSDFVRHLPRVLYNWRVIPSSVASGGIDVKPYAAKGQLLAVERYLREQGWSEATPAFSSGSAIKIAWSPSYQPRTAAILLGGEGPPPPWLFDTTDVHLVEGRLPSSEDLNALLDEIEADVFVFLPRGLNPLTPDWFDQMVGPLENNRVGVVTGKLLGRQSEVVDCGWVVSQGEARPIFRGMDRHAYTQIGGVNWTRNLAAASFAGMALRKEDWRAAGGFADIDRPDLALSDRVRVTLGRRIFYNPYAEAWLDGPRALETLLGLPQTAFRPSDNAETVGFSPHLRILPEGGIEFAASKSDGSAPNHDFSAEAGYVAITYDFTAVEVAASQKGLLTTPVPAGKRRRVAWLVPAFTMPFYGGIMTILRAADAMRSKHDVDTTFLAVGDSTQDQIRAAIGMAFPELAAVAEIVSVVPDTDLNALGLGRIDAAICTLWTTAYSLLRLENVREKLYFVQDWEPLFYPAGTTSSIVEATYRFGFRGICNTAPLASLYREQGGVADHFTPAIDPSVFNSIGRAPIDAERPVTVFSYARPGHPRNCFEVLTAGLAAAKRQLGSRLAIFTAGADWNVGDYGLGGVIEHLGLLNYEDTGTLYRACDMGVVAMATRHPSYLPFELMACGATVLTNVNPSTTWLLQHEQNSLLFNLSRSSICDAIVRAATEPKLRTRLAGNAEKMMADRFSNWSATCDDICRLVLGDGEALR